MRFIVPQAFRGDIIRSSKFGLTQKTVCLRYIFILLCKKGEVVLVDTKTALYAKKSTRSFRSTSNIDFKVYRKVV